MSPAFSIVHYQNVQLIIARLAIILVMILHVVCLGAQTIIATNHTSLKYGADAFSRAIRVDSATCLVVGDNGRFASVDLRTGIAAWDSVSLRVPLVDASLREGDLLLLSRRGTVYIKGGDIGVPELQIPDTAVCTSVAFRQKDIVVTTKSGNIWSYNKDRAEPWMLEATFDESLNAVRTNQSYSVVVGTRGFVALWDNVTERWSQVTDDSLRGDHACVMLRDRDFFIGSDSGFIYRVDVHTKVVKRIRLQQPFRFPVDAGAERPDRTLSITESSNGRIICVGYYAFSSIGCYSLSADGDSIERTPYLVAIDDLSRSPESYVLHVTTNGDTSRVLTKQGTTSPAFVLSHHATTTRWNALVVTGRFGAIRIEMSDSLVCYDEMISGVFSSSDELRTLRVRRPRPLWRNVDSAARTFVCTQPNDELNAANDTLSTLRGLYRLSYAGGDTIIMSGDSARIAVSVDAGAMWRIGTLPITSSSGIVFNPRSVVVGSTIVVNQANTLFVGDIDSMDFREVVQNKSGTDVITRTHMSSTDENRFCVLRTDFVGDAKVRCVVEEWFVDHDSIKHVQDVAIPDAHIQDIQLFVSNSVLSYVTCLWDEMDSSAVSNLLVRYVGRDWIVDTMFVRVSPSNFEKLRAPQTPTLFPFGDTVLSSYGSDGVHLCSIDGGRTWQFVAEDFTSSPRRSTAVCVSNSRVVMAGGFSWLASFKIPGIVTSVAEETGQLDTSECSGSLTWNPSLIYDIYNLQGQRIATSARIESGHVLMSDDLTLADGIVVAKCTSQQRQPFIAILRGSKIIGVNR